MPTYVNPHKCDGCRALDRLACMYIRPMDLMALDSTIGKAYNQEPDLRRECYTGVKMCPNNAIDMRGYADVMPMGATLKPVRSVVCACGGAANVWRPHAAGEGGVFRGSHAIGPCVDNNWLS